MQRLFGFLVFIDSVFGFYAAGWRGALTGLVATLAIGSGVLIASGMQGTDVETEGPIRTAQRVGGLFCAILGLVGAVWGGWPYGWLGALIGYAAGVAIAFVAKSIAQRNSF